MNKDHLLVDRGHRVAYPARFMLVIRAVQRQVFREDAMRRFEQRMVELLFEFAPQHCRGIGSARVADVVRLGIPRAARHGFVQRGPVRLYLQMMWLLGSHFDTDPQLPERLRRWLGPQPDMSAMARAAQLHSELVSHMHQVLGPDNRHARAAIARLQQMSSATALPVDTDIHDALLGLLATVYPERYRTIGPSAVQSLAQRAVAMAAGLNLLPERGAALCAVLMYELGHRCFDDPLLPWLHVALKRRPADTATLRTDRLEHKAGSYLALVARRLARAEAT